MNNNSSRYDGNTIAGFVLGIVSCLTFWHSGANIVGIVCGVVGLWLCIKARRSSDTPLSTAGFVLCICGTVFSVVSLCTCTLCTCGYLAGLSCLTCLAV